MRFVIGLIFGAGLILLATQQPDGRWLRQVPGWLDGLANAVGDALALPPRPAAGAADQGDAGRAADAAESGSEPASIAGVEPAQQPIPRPPDPPAPDSGRVRAPLAAGPEGEDVQRLVAEIFQTPAEAGSSGPTQVRAGAPTDGAPTEGEPVEAPARARTAAAGPASNAGRAAVWVPFHSRMSADGFAERLSESLDHPFRVEREGPGRYQVVFAYGDESERRALLDEAAAATGLPL